jgi:PAS domain S-box-containing protein
MASRSREAAARSLGDALHELPVAVAVQRLDEAGSIVCLNEAFTRLFGYTLADIPAVSAWALRAYPDPDYRREVFEVWDAAVDRARRERGRVETMEFRVACRDGAVRDVLIGAAVADDTLFISLTDITRRLDRIEQTLGLRPLLPPSASVPVQFRPAAPFP